MDLIRLICISSATKKPTVKELDELLKGARVRNKKRGVTGFLVYKNGIYLQVLEGDKQKVEALFDKIKVDPRSCGIVRLKEELITQRDFSQWYMGFKNLDNISKKAQPAYVEILDDGLNINNLKALKGQALNLLLNFSKKEYSNVAPI